MGWITISTKPHEVGDQHRAAVWINPPILPKRKCFTRNFSDNSAGLDEPEVETDAEMQTRVQRVVDQLQVTRSVTPML